MNPMEYFKKASEARRTLTQETTAFIEDTAPSQEDIMPILTPEQKRAMDDQNLILKYVAKKIGIKPYAVSRDKSGHALIIEVKNLDGGNYPEIYCYALGLNLETNNICAYCVAKNTFKFTNSYGYIWPQPSTGRNTNLHINILSTHPAFDGHGIGRIMLQATENIAVTNKLKTMSLKQEICYAPNSTKIADIKKTQLLAYDLNAYFKEFYFDKNMYFYYSQGFTQDESKDYYIEVTDGLVPLKKDRLQKVCLKYGLSQPLVKVDRSSPIFALKETKESPTDTAKEYCYNNRFPNFLNDFSSTKFSPIILKPNDDYTKFLYAFISTNRGNQIFVPTSENKITSARKIAEGNFELDGYKYHTICSLPEFIQATVENYKVKTEHPSINGNPKAVMPLQDFLDALYLKQANLEAERRKQANARKINDNDNNDNNNSEPNS